MVIRVSPEPDFETDYILGRVPRVQIINKFGRNIDVDTTSTSNMEITAGFDIKVIDQ